MKRLFSLIFCTISVTAFSQIQFFISNLPEKTPPNDTIFMASSLNGWNPHDKTFAFLPDNNRVQLKIQTEDTLFEFKLCRGSWSNVEVDSKGINIRNRTYRIKNGPEIIVAVAGWKDLFPAKSKVTTVSKGVAFTPTNIEIPQLNRRRTVRIYFPPNYSSGQRFPVIYMHDGQNLFDDATSFAGEWKIDETLDSLYQYRGFSCIVVGIYNDDKHRMDEYSPWRNDSLGVGGEGDKYAKFIVRTLKPFIDSHYRTLPDRDNTAIMGSSMGGLISLYIALEYPDVFGKAGIFSPSLWFSPKSFELIDKFKMKNSQRLYLTAGLLEEDFMVEDLKKAEEKLRKVGFDEQLLLAKIDSTGTHSEWFWGKEFGNVVRFLFNF